MEQWERPLPKRKKLSHEIPSWVPKGCRYFITVNCHMRGQNLLCQDRIARQLLNSAMEYERLGRWYVWLMMIMPDHMHWIASFDKERGIRRVVSAWKGYQAKMLGIEWQTDFFEHRLRTDTEYNEKAEYIRCNPVRKGLVANIEEWPYIWDRSR